MACSPQRQQAGGSVSLKSVDRGGLDNTSAVRKQSYLSDSLRPTSEIVAHRCLALLTPQHCMFRWLVGLPLATAPFRWLQHRRGTVCHQRLGPAPHLWHFGGRPSLTFFVSHTADVALSIYTVRKRLHWAAQRFMNVVNCLATVSLVAL